MTVKKNDFIQIQFTGKISDTNTIFDTTRKEDAKSAGIKTENLRPFILAVGHKMLPPGFDEDLEGREENKEYTVELNPEKAFGKRNPQMVRMIPTKQFHAQNINPAKGMQLNLDGQLVRVLASDPARTLVDFNNPLAGKKITYTYQIEKKITNTKEKVNALQEFLLRKTFDFEVQDKKIIFTIPKEAEQFIKLFAPKFEEIMGLSIETKVIKDEPKKKKK